MDNPAVKPRTAYIDFETRSACDIKKAGADRYAEDSSTVVMCIAYCFDDGRMKIWTPQRKRAPIDLLRHVASSGRVVAHNAHFEMTIWQNVCVRLYGWPALAPDQVYDTMASARAMSLPGALGDCAAALGLPVQKDKVGHRIMLKLSKPRRARKGESDEVVHYYDPTPREMLRLIRYCADDVRVERELDKRLRPLTKAERAMWLLDWRINQRGIPIDRDAIAKAADLIRVETQQLARQVSDLTSQAVPSANARDALLSYVRGLGVTLPDLKAHTVKALLDAPTDQISKTARRLLELRKETSKASTAKLRAMVAGCSVGDRARGCFAYHGATTGRWAGRRVQPQNLMRTPEDFTIEDAELIIDALSKPGAADVTRLQYGSAMDAIAWTMRSFVKAAPGHRLMACDFANIEGRVLAWLAGEHWKINAFRAYDAKQGPDLYYVAYSRAFGVPVEQVTKAQRQIGKVMELALGYQGGPNAYVSMVENYGIDLDDIVSAVREASALETWGRYVDIWDWLAHEKHSPPSLPREQWAACKIIVDGWRAAHPRVVQLWADLEAAAVAAVRTPGTAFRAGQEPVAFGYQDDYLICRLPSGRPITYPFPRVQTDVKRKKGADGVWREVEVHRLEYKGISSKVGAPKVWGWQHPYGGLFAENVVQAVARDVLAEAIARCEAAGYPTVLHVHDENVAEVPNGVGSYAEFAALMSVLPKWAEGLPLAVDGWEGERYRK